MGGYGSGFRGIRKLTTSECLCLNIAQLSKGYLQPESTLSVKWEGGASIDIEVHDTYLQLQYALKGQEHIYPVRLNRMACNYGGYRTWFICPCCGKRALKLYLKAGKFLCRKCHNLNYKSSQKNHDEIARVDYKLTTKAYKLGIKGLCTYELLAELPFIQKPKGMHWRTYEQIQGELLSLLSSRNDALVDILE